MQKNYIGWYIDACSVLITLFIIFFHVVFIFDLLKFIFISFLVTLKRHLSLFMWSTCPLVELSRIVTIIIFNIIVIMVFSMVYEMRALNLLWIGRSSFALLSSLLHLWGALCVCELVIFVVDIVVVITIRFLVFQLCGSIVIRDDFIGILRLVNIVILLLFYKLGDCSDWLLCILCASPWIWRLSDCLALWVVWVSDLMEVLVSVLYFVSIILIIFISLNDTRANSCLIIIFKVTVRVLSTISTSRLTQDLLAFRCQSCIFSRDRIVFSLIGTLFSTVLFGHPWVLIWHIHRNGLVLYVRLNQTHLSILVGHLLMVLTSLTSPKRLQVSRLR